MKALLLPRARGCLWGSLTKACGSCFEWTEVFWTLALHEMRSAALGLLMIFIQSERLPLMFKR